MAAGLSDKLQNALLCGSPSPSRPANRLPQREPKVQSEQPVPHSARLFARFARRARSVFYFCCIQLGSCWARPVLRRIFSPGDINILRVAQMFSHVIGSNVTSHWEVSFMFLFFSKQTYLRTKYLFIAGALPGGVPQFFYHKCRCLGTIWHQKRTNSKEK